MMMMTVMLLKAMSIKKMIKPEGFYRIEGQANPQADWILYFSPLCFSQMSAQNYLKASAELRAQHIPESVGTRMK